MSLSTKTKRKILAVGFQTILLAIMWGAMFLISRDLSRSWFLGTFMTVIILWTSKGLYKEDCEKEEEDEKNLKS